MNPIHKNIIKRLCALVIPEKDATQIYTLTRFLYGSKWDKQRLRMREPIKDKPHKITISSMSISPEQELFYLLKKYKTNIQTIQWIV